MPSDILHGFRVGHWKVEPRKDAITGPDERPHHLQPKVMDVLVCLARNADQPVSRDELLKEVWGEHAVSDEPLTRAIGELRRALQDDRGHPKYIETIPKRGYRLIAKVHFPESSGEQPTIESQSSETIAATSGSARLVSRSTVILGAVALIAITVMSVAYLTTLKTQTPASEILVETINRPPPPPNSVAVLPFVNTSGSADNEYFSDGLTDTLLHALAQLPDLRVPGRTSVFYFKGQGIDVREAAKELGVSKVLEGSVQRDGDTVRIVVQLIDAETGFQLWSNTYDREMSDIFAVQDDITRSVALAMKVKFADDRGVDKIETVSTKNVAAYEKYLKGLQQKNIFSHTSLMPAEISFKEALALDPGFYEARLELIQTYAFQAVVGAITWAEAWEHEIPLADRLLEEKPDDGLVIMMVGYMQYARSELHGDVAFDVEKHLDALAAAIERMPNEPRLYEAMAQHLRWDNRPVREGIEWVDRGIAVDPLNWTLHFDLGSRLLNIGNLEGAEASLARAIELNPDTPVSYGLAATIPWRRKQYAEWFALGRKMMEIDAVDHETPATFAQVLYTVGLTDEGDKYLQRAITLAPESAYVRKTRLYRLLLLGDHLGALEMSERMLRDDIDIRRGAYGLALMVFVSTMAELEKTDEALAVLEELQPGVSLPDFVPQTRKEQVLQYYAILALNQSDPKEEMLRVLDGLVSRWHQSSRMWRPSLPLAGALIAMARGQRELAVELALEHLDLDDGMLDAVLYRHIDFFKALAQEPAVAERLRELDAEAKKAGEDIWAYIVEQQLRL